jgi:hypothetical protein
MTIDLVVAVAKRVPVILEERWRRRRVAEPGMAIHIGGRTLCNVALSRLEPVVVTLLCDLRIRGRGWRRRVVRSRLWMMTSCNYEREQQCCHRKKLLHDRSSLMGQLLSVKQTRPGQELLCGSAKKED